MVNLQNVFRELALQFSISIFLALAIPQGAYWPLFVFLLELPFRAVMPGDQVCGHTTRTFMHVIVEGKGLGNWLQFVIAFLIQIAGGILAGWVSFLVVDSAETAPVVADGIGNGRAFVVLAVVTLFSHFLFSRMGAKSDGLEGAATWIGSVFAIQMTLPGAVGNINTDIGRIIGAQIFNAGGPSTGDATGLISMPDFSGTWVFIVAPLVGLIGVKLYNMLEDALEGKGCMDCGGSSGGDNKGVPQAIPQNAHQQGVSMAAQVQNSMPQAYSQPQAYGSPIHGSVPQLNYGNNGLSYGQ